MAEFHGILLFFFNVWIAYRGGGWDGQRNWVGGGKNYRLGHPFSSHNPSRYPHNGPCLVSRPHNSVSNFRSPPPNWHLPKVPLFQLGLWRFGKMPYRKAHQLAFNIIDTLGMGSH